MFFKANNVFNAFPSARLYSSLCFTSNLKKKGARRRTWWHPKLLRNRLYKGYGAGSFMSCKEGRYELNKERIREYIPPTTHSNMRPYCDPQVFVEKTKKPSKFDLYQKMCEAESNQSDLNGSSGDNRIDYLPLLEKRLLGMKSGKLSRWGA